MPFIAYFFVLVLTAVTAAVSLDYLTAPEVPAPKQDTTKVAGSAPATNPIRQVPLGKPSRETTAQASNDGNDKALTPVYPAAPGKNLPQPDATDTTTAAASASDRPAATAQAATAQAAAATPVAPTNEPVKNEPTSSASAQPSATPVSVQASVGAPAGACAIEACASAYRSFRASDCTYQPFGGPRKMCELTSDGARQASNAPAASEVSLRGSSAMRGGNANVSRSRGDNLDDVVRAVRRLPGPQADYGDDQDDFDGGRVVVIQRDGPRAYDGARSGYGPRYIYEAR